MHITDSLRTHGLVSNTILMNLNLPRQALTVCCRADKNFRKLMRPATLHFNKNVLLNNISHLLFLLLSLVYFFLQFGDLSVDSVKAMTVS